MLVLRGSGRGKERCERNEENGRNERENRVSGGEGPSYLVVLCYLRHSDDLGATRSACEWHIELCAGRR